VIGSIGRECLDHVIILVTKKDYAASWPRMSVITTEAAFICP
jgi:hypothetical protein